MRAVVEVARLKSFTRAAERLHITQQGLSLMIQEVETQLDCRLFDRTTRAVARTPAGRQFVPVAEQALQSLESVSSVLGQMSLRARSSLSVAATPLVAATLLPGACALSHASQPQVSVRVFDVGRPHIQALVESGEADVGFGAFLKPAASLERKLIFRCNLVHLSSGGSARHREQRARPRQLSWKALADEVLVGLPAGNEVQQLVDSHLRQISRANDDRRTFRNFLTILSMVEAGFGSAILPSFALSAAKRMNIQVAQLTDPVVPVNFFQVNLKGRARSPAEGPFVEALLQTMKAQCSLDGH